MDFAIFSSMIKKVYPDTVCSYSLKDVLMVFRYFFDEYERIMGVSHPPISRATAKKIMEAMPRTADDLPLDPDQYIDLIDDYYQTTFHDGCDYRITHFFSGQIRDHRLYETSYHD